VGPPGPPSPLVSFAVNPPTITGGSTVEGILTLGAAAPAPQGKLVRISSDDPALVSVPSTVTVPAGSSTQSFPVKTAWATSTRSVGMTATLEGVAWSATLTVQARLRLGPAHTAVPTTPARGSPGAGGIHRVRLVLCGGSGILHHPGRRCGHVSRAALRGSHGSRHPPRPHRPSRPAPLVARPRQRRSRRRGDLVRAATRCGSFRRTARTPGRSPAARSENPPSIPPVMMAPQGLRLKAVPGIRGCEVPEAVWPPVSGQLAGWVGSQTRCT